jgi:hypothetical protein
VLTAEIRRLQPSPLLPQHPDDLLFRKPSALHVRLQTGDRLYLALVESSGLRSHRSTEFRKFLDQVQEAVPPDLDVQLVMDNYATHKTKPVRGWLLKPPRWHVHFTPTGAS